MTNVLVKLAVLKKHRDNLATARTLEEYKEAHVAYIDTIIKGIEAEDAAEKFIATNWTIATEEKDD